MEILRILIAAAASFAIGAVWYMALANPWMQAAGIERGADGRPKGGQSPMLFVGSFLLQLLVAGMLRHVFTAGGVTTIIGGIMSGGGVGLFFITPWIGINNMYSGRPARLTLIDGGYATVACATMGLVLVLI
jgi:Protein of unknown function (DUF1761)